MATSKRKPKTVADEDYSALDMYCIWLHEYHRALRRAGFSKQVIMLQLQDCLVRWHRVRC